MLLAVLIISSAVLASPGVGSVGAIHNCDSKDAAVYGFSFGYINEDKCSNNHVDYAVEQVRDAEEQQSKVDIYSSLNAQKSRSQTFNAVYGNYLNDTESVAWMKAEAAVAEAYEEGATKSQAKTRAKEAIADYFAVKQINLIEDWAAQSNALWYAQKRSEQEGHSSSTATRNYQQDGQIYLWGKQSGSYDSDTQAKVVSPQTYNYTLINGTTYTADVLMFNESGNPDNPQPVDVRQSRVSDTDTSSAYYHGVRVNPPNSNYDRIDFVDFSQDNSDRWNRIRDKNNNLQSEADAYVDATWQDYQDGKINSSDVLSRTTTMFEYGTQAQNGSYYDVIGAAAAMGLETPNLEETGQMTITLGSGETVDGMVFARNPPNGTWQVGETYDPNNIKGPVQVATTSGEMRELSRPFTIESATDKQGNSRETVETTRYNYKTANTSQTTDKYAELLGLTGDLQQRSESVESNDGGGGGSSGGGSLPDWLTQSFFGIPVWVIVALFLLAIVIFGGGS